MLSSTKIKGYNEELARLNPYSKYFALKTGNSYPWLGNSSTGNGISPSPTGLYQRFGKKKKYSMASKGPRSTDINDGPSRFGKKKKKKPKKNIAGYCIVNNKVVTVYKYKGSSRKFYGSNCTVKKSFRCFRTKKQAVNFNRKHSKRVCGYCIINKKVVAVYKYKGRSGKYYGTKNYKVKKGFKCFKTKKQALKANKKPPKRKPRGKRKRGSWGTRYKIGKCWVNGRYVNIYEYDYRSGTYLANGRRVPSSSDCYYVTRVVVPYSRTYPKPQQTYHKPSGAYRRTANISSSSGCSGRSYNDCNKSPGCEWAGWCRKRGSEGDIYEGPSGPSNYFGRATARGPYQARSVNPANRVNYIYQQYSDNVGTPTVKQMNKIAGVPAYAYPMNTQQLTWSPNKLNLSGMGF
jgi:hypothetical protein